MPYRPGHPLITNRFGASTAALPPASVASGFIGTCCLAAVMIVMAAASGDLHFQSIGEVLAALFVLGAVIAIGTIGGTFVVAFYLIIFGWPVASLLGERIKDTAGFAATIAAAGTAFLFALSWTWGWSLISARALNWEMLIPVALFAVPASFLYRRFVIAEFDQRAYD